MNGVYNRKLFIDTARPARQKLAKMGGIMASSSDLLQAAMPPVQPMAPAPMPMPQPMPQPVMMAPVMPAQPMPMPAPAPMPAQPMVQQTPPPAPTQPMAFAPGGSVDAEGRRRRQNRKPVDISKAPTVEQTEGTRGALGILAEMDSGAADAAIARYGSPEAAEKALSEKGQKIDDLAEKDTETAVKGTLEAAEVPNTTEGKQEFARQVLGMEDVSDIAEIDRRIVDVLQGNAVGKGADAFAIATLAGLEELKKTAEKKAATKAGAKMSPLEPFPDAVRDLAGKIMTATGEDASVAIQQARDALIPYYTGQATPTAAQTQPTISSEARLNLVKDALKQQPEKRELILQQAAKDGVNIEGL